MNDARLARNGRDAEVATQHPVMRGGCRQIGGTATVKRALVVTQNDSTQSVGTGIPTRSAGTRKLATASHQLHVGGVRVMRQLDARLLLTLG
jgi:hypothetical protein